MKHNEYKNEIESAQDLKGLDAVYKKYLGKKGELALALRELGKLSPEEKKDRSPGCQKSSRTKECGDRASS